MDESNLHNTYDSFVPKLAARLRKFREETGKSRETIANEAWVAPFTYFKYENGESNLKTPMNPEIGTLLRVADAFNMNVLELLDVDDDQSHLYSHIYMDAKPGESLNLTPEEFAALFGERLQKLRWEKHLSKQRVAREAGISGNSYHFLEKGESKPGTPANPRLKTLLGIADALGVSLIELLDFSSTDMPPEVTFLTPGSTKKNQAPEEEWLALI